MITSRPRRPLLLLLPVNILALLTRRSKKTPLRDKELRFSPKKLFRLKDMLLDPDREVNFSDSKLVKMLEMHTRQEVAVVAEEVAVDVQDALKAHNKEPKVVVKEGEERLLP